MLIFEIMKFPKLTIYQKIIEAISLVLVVATIVTTVILYTKLPDQVPKHFDINGHVDAWAGKASVFTIPAFDLVMYALFIIIMFFPKALKPNTLKPLDMRFWPQIQQETISVLAECTLLCVLLFGYMQLFILMQNPMIVWPVWIICGLMLVSCFIRMKRLSKYTLK